MRLIATSTLTDQSLVTALETYEYIADATRAIYVRLTAGQVAGGGTYKAWVTLQRLGAGVEYEIQPRTESSVASGVVSIGFTTITIPVEATDVLRVYLIGLAADTTTPDITTDIFEADYLRPSTPGQHYVDVDAVGGVEVGAMAAAVITAIATAVWVNATRTLTSFGTLLADIIAAVTAAISAGIPITLTQTPAEIAAAVQGSRLTIQRDSDWLARIYIAGGISSTRDDLLFTVKTSQKKDSGAADSEAIIQLSEVGGLLYLNGDDGDIAEGSLTVVDEMDGDGNGVVDLVLTSTTTAQLAKYTSYTWDIKEVEEGADLARVEGLLDVASSVTRTISP